MIVEELPEPGEPHYAGASTRDWPYQWWKKLRWAWGRLQQVKKGTRVKCLYCGANGDGRKGNCPALECTDGFMDRDHALGTLEMEMEMALK